MLTSTHVFVGAAGAIELRTSAQVSVGAAIAGSAFADLHVLAFRIYVAVSNIDERLAWDVVFREAPWRWFGWVSNSLVIWGLVLSLGLFAQVKRADGGSSALLARTVGFSLGLALHGLGDLVTHASDPHEHFWPVSHYTFESPVSYWDFTHHARFILLGEAAFAAVFVWRYRKLLRFRVTALVVMVAIGTAISAIRGVSVIDLV